MQKQFFIGLHKNLRKYYKLNSNFNLTLIGFYSSVWQLNAFLPLSLTQINASVLPNSLTLASNLPGTSLLHRHVTARAGGAHC